MGDFQVARASPPPRVLCPYTDFIVPDKAAPIPNRPLFKISMATLNPPPTSPRTFSAGTRVPSKWTSAVGEH